MRKCRLSTCRQELPKVKDSDWSQSKGFCDIDHMTAHGYAKALQAQERRRKAQEREARAEHRKAKERIKTRSKWLSEAQGAFNDFIRERDKNLPCICCGNWPDSDDYKPGGTWDCGHFKSRGAFPELRFEELNAHKQLKTCNGGSNKYAKKGRTVSEGYRARLIEKIGQAAVDWLEGPHEPKKYTIDDLKAIKAEYKEKLKYLRDQPERHSDGCLIIVPARLNE